MGGKLGTLFTRAGHDVVFSYARSRQKLEPLAHEPGRNARAGTAAEAVRDAEPCCSPCIGCAWTTCCNRLASCRERSFTCSLPMNATDSALVVAHTTSGAEELAKKIPHAKVVSAFGTVPSEVLFGVFDARNNGWRPSMAYCGDDDAAKDGAAMLIRDLGFAPVDAGSLRIARYLEPFALSSDSSRTKVKMAGGR